MRSGTLAAQNRGGRSWTYRDSYLTRILGKFLLIRGAQEMSSISAILFHGSLTYSGYLRAVRSRRQGIVNSYEEAIKIGPLSMRLHLVRITSSGSREMQALRLPKLSFGSTPFGANSFRDPHFTDRWGIAPSSLYLSPDTNLSCIYCTIMRAAYRLWFA